jgi:hypothetical protein
MKDHRDIPPRLYSLSRHCASREGVDAARHEFRLYGLPHGEKRPRAKGEWIPIPYEHWLSTFLMWAPIGRSRTPSLFPQPCAIHPLVRSSSVLP